MKYEVQSIPLVLIFKDGKVVESMVGLRLKDDYKIAIGKLLV